MYVYPQTYKVLNGQSILCTPASDLCPSHIQNTLPSFQGSQSLILLHICSESRMSTPKSDPDVDEPPRVQLLRSNSSSIVLSLKTCSLTSSTPTHHLHTKHTVMGYTQDNCYRLSCLKGRKTRGTKESLVHNDFEIQVGKHWRFFDQISWLCDNSLGFQALPSELLVSPFESSFLFHEMQHVFAAEDFSQSASCQQNFGTLVVSFHFVLLLSLLVDVSNVFADTILTNLSAFYKSHWCLFHQMKATSKNVFKMFSAEKLRYSTCKLSRGPIA